MTGGLLKTGKSPDCDRTIKRKKLIISSIALALFVIVGSLIPLSAQAPVKQGDIPELRVAVFIAPPMVVEQNGSLTGFSIDLWSAIATRLKVKTSYQIMPDANAVEEAMRSKSADLSPAIAITSVRDDVFDFSYPILGDWPTDHGARDRRNAGDHKPPEPCLGHAPFAVFAYDYRMARRRITARPHPGSRGLVSRTAATRRYHYKPKLFPWHL